MTNGRPLDAKDGADKAYEAWLKGLWIGDPVVVLSSGNLYTDTVVHATRTTIVAGLCSLEFRRKDGVAMGRHAHNVYLRQPTPELLAEIQLKREREACIRAIKGTNFKRLPHERLKAIADLCRRP